MTSDDQGDELLRAENEQLHELEARLEAALRAGKRQSAPFSKRGAEG
jgi:hypothetical protein